MRCRGGDRENLRLPDRLHPFEKVLSIRACRFPAVVVSTSSVALQDAIIGEYIPFLSRIFLENHIIPKPIRAMVRKGKERFVCDARLAQRLEAVKGKNKNEEQRKALFSLKSNYDLDAVTGLSGFDRRQVCVPKVCKKTCRLRNSCRYHQYLKESPKCRDLRPDQHAI